MAEELIKSPLLQIRPRALASIKTDVRPARYSPGGRTPAATCREMLRF